MINKFFLFGVFILIAGLVTVNAQTATVQFEVNMGVKMCEMSFIPATDTVYVRGSFNGWGQTAMSAINDSIYSVTDTLNVGDTLYFKYYTNHGSGVWEGDPNRELVVQAGSNVYSDYFDRDSVCNPVGTGNVLFTVSMKPMVDAGIFDPGADSVIISASFNGWSTTNDETTRMNQSVTDPNIWSKNVTFTNEPLGADEAFKFLVIPADTNSIWTDGYERPLSQGGGNRDFIFNGDAQAYYYSFYDDVNPEWGINSGTALNVTFTVDMTNATNPDSQSVQFVPGTDSVYWVSEEPAFQQTQGWTQNGRTKMVPLTQQGSSNIYSGSFTVQDPSFDGFEYLYGFTHMADGSFYEEAGGYQDFAYRVRYVTLTAPHVFTNPYSFPQDSWTNDQVKVNETAPPTAVNDPNQTVLSYQLAQNFPNPFNPTTKIKFSIPERGLVTLKVFNVLGQEVKTLVDKQYSAGSYEVNFDASKLSSGVYFYTITAGSYHATKKMMLLK